MIAVSLRRQGLATLIEVRGRMDATTSPDFEVACRDTVESGEGPVILDLGEVEYISSAGIRSLLVMGKRLHQMGRNLRLANAGGPVAEVLEMSGCYAVFERFESGQGAAAG